MPPAASRAGAPDDAETDAAVILRSLEEPTRFGEVFRRHAPALHRYVARRPGGPDADDILSTDWSLVDEDDRPAWERDGSPTFWPYDSEAERPEIPTVEEGDGPADAGAASYGFGYGTLIPRELQELPSDPAQLRGIPWDEQQAEDVDQEFMEEMLAEEGYHGGSEQRFSLLTGALDLPLPPRSGRVCTRSWRACPVSARPRA